MDTILFWGTHPLNDYTPVQSKINGFMGNSLLHQIKKMQSHHFLISVFTHVYKRCVHIYICTQRLYIYAHLPCRNPKSCLTECCHMVVACPVCVPKFTKTPGPPQFIANHSMAPMCAGPKLGPKQPRENPPLLWSHLR